MSEFEKTIMQKLAAIEYKVDKIIHMKTNPSIPYELQLLENAKNANKQQQGLSYRSFK